MALAKAGMITIGMFLAMGMPAQAATLRTTTNTNLRILPSPTPTIKINIPERMLPAQLKIGAVPTPEATTSAARINGTIVKQGVGSLELKNIGQATWLNPQPEPPIPNTPEAITTKRLNYALTANKIKTVGEIMTENWEGKKAFSATVEVPAKLLGFIPITLREKVIMGEDGRIAVTNKPWQAKISKENINLISNLDLKPNLVVKGVRFEPAQFKEGDKVKVIAQIANEGLGLAIGFPDLVGNTGSPTEVLRWLDEGSNSYSWYPIIVYLEPGQTEERGDFYVNTVACGENMKYEFVNSEGSHIEETTKDDNAIQFKMECSK